MQKSGYSRDKQKRTGRSGFALPGYSLLEKRVSAFLECFPELVERIPNAPSGKGKPPTCSSEKACPRRARSSCVYSYRNKRGRQKRRATVPERVFEIGVASVIPGSPSQVFPKFVGKRHSEIPFDNLRTRSGRALVRCFSKELRESVAER